MEVLPRMTLVELTRSRSGFGICTFLSCSKLVITSQKKILCVSLCKSSTLETIFAYSTSKFSSEVQLISMDYINSQEKKIAHGVLYKMPELQDSC